MKVLKAVVYLPEYLVRNARVFLVSTLVLTIWVVSLSPTHAAAPYRNSVVSYRNSVSVISLQKDADLSFNPYYAMTLGLSPRWWFGESVFVQGQFSLTRELTNSDTTTQHGETVPGDLRIKLGASDLVRVPGIGIDVSTALEVVLPTSPVSRARSLMTTLAGSVSLKRQFSWLQGVSFSYAFQFQKGFHEFTTSQFEQPIISGCATALECAELTHTGVRNSSYRMVHSLSAGVGILSWLSAHLSYGLITDTLYDLSIDSSVTHEAQEPQNTRYMAHADMGLSFAPMPSLGITLGMSTVNPLLAPDSSSYTPVFNRYSVVYLDLTLDIAGLVSQVTKK